MKIVILGGGITGLALAWYLQQRHKSNAKVILIERASRLGGWIRTIERDGYLFDLGPRSCRARGAGADTLQLIDELGFHKSVIWASKAASDRFLYVNKSLQPLPRGLLSALTSPLTRPVARALATEWSIPRGGGDETVDEFISRRLGRHAADILFDPLIKGIFAGDSRQLSMRSCFPQLYEWEQQHGSLTKGFLYSSRSGRSGLFTLRGGMEQLVRALEGNLEADVRHDVAAVEISRDGVRLSNGWCLSADHVYSTLPAIALAPLVRGSDAEAARLLGSSKCATVTVVSMGYRELKLPKEGFGYLVPSISREPILGVVWDSSVFPEQNRWVGQTRLTAMLPDETLQPAEIAQEAIRRHMGIQAPPDLIEVTVARHAIPQYLVGHCERAQKLRERLRETLPELTVMGSGFDGVAVNDCIALAKRTAWLEVTSA